MATRFLLGYNNITPSRYRVILFSHSLSSIIYDRRNVVLTSNRAGLYGGAISLNAGNIDIGRSVCSGGIVPEVRARARVRFRVRIKQKPFLSLSSTVLRSDNNGN